MKKILVFAIGLALLVGPIIFFGALGAGSSGGGPIAFGMWMFFGLPLALGSIFFFRLASKLD